MTFHGHFFTVDALTDSLFEASFPGLNREEHYKRADAWCHVHPRKRPKKNWNEFVYRWLSRNATVKTQMQDEVLTDRDGNRYTLSVDGVRVYIP